MLFSRLPFLALLLHFSLLSVFLVTVTEAKIAPNRLLKEASPYLQQHAYNPINWYPWGKEAFAKAKRENKPIFLSIGYSTCHWCHVMEEESFSQKDIGALLNKYFVAIKVDRERRPALDEYYMMATQIITGTGGWPNNLFLTPEQKPFFAGGYFPKDQFAKLLLAVNGQWDSKNRKELVKDGDKINSLIQKAMNRQEQAQSLDETAVKKASRILLKHFEPFYGGFATGPKFPEEPKLMFLSRVAMQYGDKKALAALKQTVDAILDGGIHDHVGGGFHRYAIDNAWLTPHFEKMLYNQAQMVRVLVRLYQLTGERRYKQAAERTLDFVMRDMTSPEGGFYAAYDADSKGGEGRYYTWSLAEIKAALSAKEAGIAIKLFGMSQGGNFEGYNILHFPDGLSSVPFRHSRVDDIRKALLAARNKRQKPHLDKKIIASWNGMMITAFAEAGRILEQPKYNKAAEKALRFIENKMTFLEGGQMHLKRSWFDGKADLKGQLSDYAALSVGAFSVFDGLSFKAGLRWRKLAERYLETVNGLFLDQKQGDYFIAEAKAGGQELRIKKRDDSAVPSGNALMLEALAMASIRSAQPEFKQRADALLVALSGLIIKDSVSPFGLYAADLHLRGVGSSALAFSLRGPQLFYGANGHVKIRVAHFAHIHKVSIRIEDGWHINGHKPLEAFFIPTEIKIKLNKNQQVHREVKIEYPKGILKRLGFNSKEMVLYEDKAEISVKPLFNGRASGFFPWKIIYQACSDKICLEPDEIKLGKMSLIVPRKF